MATRTQKDGVDSLHRPYRSPEEIFLDRFADSPYGGTKLSGSLKLYPANDYFSSLCEIERTTCHQLTVIFRAYEDLHCIVQRHEYTMRNR
jgi:hypothetical protein